MNEDQTVSVLNDFVVFISIGVLLLVLMTIVLIVWVIGSTRIKQIIQQKATNFKKNFVWNGFIHSLKVSNFKNNIAIGNQVRLLVAGSIFVKTKD